MDRNSRFLLAPIARKEARRAWLSLAVAPPTAKALRVRAKSALALSCEPESEERRGPLAPGATLADWVEMREHLRSAVERFMTPSPTCIGRKERLSAAHERMRSLGVRQLPVVDGPKLVGILSQRDLFFVESIRDLHPTDARVEDAMSTDVYVVPPDRPVGEVAARMVECKYGCAVVESQEGIVGLFTTTDALRVLVSSVEAWL